LDGVKVYQYNGTEVKLVKDHIKRAEITTRDIDRRDFLHFFMKEVSESPRSVLKTFRGKMGIIKSDGARKAIISLDERVIPTKIVQALRDGKIKHIFTVGQGTAAVAAQGVANILHDYISSKVSVSAEKASELSGFHLRQDLSDTLVIAISQSGTTTDTNKAVDLARKRGAFTMAIVNRRGSDITYKVDGVFYTSDGRDIEMSVASTKAFYSQIIAGNLIALRFSQILGTCSEEFIINEMRDIRRLPGLMEQVLEKKEEIAKCAREYALSKRHWAVVGSGPNKVASDEIRIKLSELCYKTISTDTVEDKKHIDLSSEPLIIVCAGGVNDVVLSDIVKDVAIFKAHHATSIVITSDEEKEFKGYAASIISIPHANERLAPILNTIAGHIFGYYAALSIDEEARFFSKAKADITKKITRFLEQGLSLYDIISHRDFNAIINRLYIQFQEKKRRNRFAAASEVNTISTLTLLFKYALGRIPLRDFSEDFGVEGTLQNFLDILVQTLDKAINELSRPIDAIRHQAKTVTVGTSRKVKEVSGPLFDELREMGIRLDEIQSRNLTSLKRIQRAIFRVSGSTLYEISNLDTEGMPKSNSKIEVLLKRGISCDMNSRAERDKTLKGTKKSIVRSGDVFVGVGKLDRKHIVIVPVVSGGWVRRLALLHVEFNEELSLRDKIVALGEKYDNIVDDVTEYEIKWCDDYLDRFSTSELFTQSEESIVNTIIQGN
jgi:glucosamine--fructose-6-phosphate aminotransferase (isomerizing)